MSWADFQGQEELTRLSWNAQFDKEREQQVVEFSNLTQCAKQSQI
jgi:hypothetical protein